MDANLQRLSKRGFRVERGVQCRRPLAPMESSTAEFASTTLETRKEGFLYAAIILEILLGLLCLIIWAIVRFCCFRKVLKEDQDGPTDLHHFTNADIEKQKALFKSTGGQPGAVSREEHDRNMKRLRKVLGDNEADKLEKQLDAAGLELDADAMDEAMKKGGPEVGRVMMRERCGFNEAVKIVVQRQAAEALQQDPEMRKQLATNPEMQQQALESGAITKSQLEQLKSEVEAGGTQETGATQEAANTQETGGN